MFTFFWRLLWVYIADNTHLWPWVFLGKKRDIWIGERVGIGLGYHIAVAPTWVLRIGWWTRINRFFTCWVSDRVIIGEDCLLSYNVSIQSGNHSFWRNEIPGTSADTTGPIHIGSRCFIWCWVVIVKWVTLGENCVVWANSVVTKSFPAGSIIWWNPAILIKNL